MATGYCSKMLIICVALRLGKTSHWDMEEQAGMEKKRSTELVFGSITLITD